MPEVEIDSFVQLEFLGRIALATICGMFIGWERERRLKSAGLRTHMLVALASSLMMIVSKYAFMDVVYLQSVQVDASRVAAGVVQAIGFLGAGVIFVKKDNVVGVTTAAGLWAMVGIGLTIGAGLYVLGIAATFLIILIQLIVHRGEHKSFNSNNGSIQINLTKHDLSLEDVREKLLEHHIIMKNITISRNNEQDYILNASILSSHLASGTDVANFLNNLKFIDLIEVYTID